MSIIRRDSTRRRVLAGGAAALAVGAILPAIPASATQADRDMIDLLYAQEQALIDHYTSMLDTFDEAAFREAGLPDGVRATIEEILAAEEAHQAVVTRPNQPPATSPNMMLSGDPVAAMRQAAQLENLTVAAYAFVIPELGRQGLIPELLGIHSVEARHGAWLATLLGDDPFPVAIDPPLTLKDEDPTVTPPPATPEAPGDPVADAALEPIVAAITAELGITPSEVNVVSATEEIWPNASLGCPQPDMLYAQVVTPGFRLVVDVGGEQIEFHADERGSIVRCP